MHQIASQARCSCYVCSRMHGPGRSVFARTDVSCIYAYAACIVSHAGVLCMCVCVCVFRCALCVCTLCVRAPFDTYIPTNFFSTHIKHAHDFGQLYTHACTCMHMHARHLHSHTHTHGTIEYHTQMHTHVLASFRMAGTTFVSVPHTPCCLLR